MHAENILQYSIIIWQLFKRDITIIKFIVKLFTFSTSSITSTDTKVYMHKQSWYQMNINRSVLMLTLQSELKAVRDPS